MITRSNSDRVQYGQSTSASFRSLPSSRRALYRMNQPDIRLPSPPSSLPPWHLNFSHKYCTIQILLTPCFWKYRQKNTSVQRNSPDAIVLEFPDSLMHAAAAEFNCAISGFTSSSYGVISPVIGLIEPGGGRS